MNKEKLVVYNTCRKNRFGCTTSLTVWSYEDEGSMEECKKHLESTLLSWKSHRIDAKADTSKCDARWLQQCEDYIKQYEEELKTLRVINTADYQSEMDKLLLTEPFEITEEVYYEMLEVLPPLKFTGNGFLMSEFYTGSYTTQFFKKGRKFYGAMVDFKRKETWH